MSILSKQQRKLYRTELKELKKHEREISREELADYRTANKEIDRLQKSKLKISDCANKRRKIIRRRIAIVEGRLS